MYREGFSTFPIFLKIFRLTAKAVWQEPKRGWDIVFINFITKFVINFIVKFAIKLVGFDKIAYLCTVLIINITKI